MHKCMYVYVHMYKYIDIEICVYIYTCIYFSKIIKDDRHGARKITG